MDQATAYAHALRRISNGTRAYALSRIRGSVWEALGAETSFNVICESDHARAGRVPLHYAHGHEKT